MTEGDFEMSFGFFDQFLIDDDDEINKDGSEEELSTDAMGMLNPSNPTMFPESHVMNAIFEPIKDDVKPMESSGSDGNFFSSYSKMESDEDPNWKFGQKSPGPDNVIMKAVHNLLHKNSLAKAASENKH